MSDFPLGAALVSSLVSALIDRETVKKTVDLLLYNAATFLQMRRQKAGAAPAAQEAAKEKASPKAAAAKERGPAQLPTPRVKAALDEAQLGFAERELQSLLVQLENHHKLLTIKQEQVSQFGEFAPPYMKLGVMNEQRAIVEKLERVRLILGDVLEGDPPDIEPLVRAVAEGGAGA